MFYTLLMQREDLINFYNTDFNLPVTYTSAGTLYLFSCIQHNYISL
jgi:hypothetical protein